MGLTCQRGEFDLPRDVHFLNCAYMGPLPVRAQEAGIAGIRAKAVPTGIAAADFFHDSDVGRGLFAALIGATEAARVAILPSVSYGMAVVARNLEVLPGQRIVLAGGQFPSNVYSWRRLAGRVGAQLHTVPAPAGPDRGEAWTEAIVAAIDERVALVALPHVHWTDGTRFDLERIGARARHVGAAFVIDGTQSIGAMPFDVQRVGADAVICAGYKWLLGPYGVSWGWFGPRFDDGEPLEETWIGRRDSHDFQRLVEYRDDYQPGAVRFDMGERSNFVLLPMAIEAMRLVQSWGAAAIQDYCAELFGPIIAEAADLGFVTEPAEWRGAHLFGLRAPAGIDLDGLDGELRRRRVYASLRGTALRIAPNAYNDATDAAALLDALRAVRRPAETISTSGT
jgi:selenocysteine lyase/cysteine desulfurase